LYVQSNPSLIVSLLALFGCCSRKHNPQVSNWSITGTMDRIGAK